MVNIIRMYLSLSFFKGTHWLIRIILKFKIYVQNPYRLRLSKPQHTKDVIKMVPGISLD